MKPTYDEGSQEWLFDMVRTERNQRLVDCDWTQFPDSPLIDSQKTEWASYRQSLRDITTDLVIPTNSKGYPIMSSIEWPTEPE